MEIFKIYKYKKSFYICMYYVSVYLLFLEYNVVIFYIKDNENKVFI